MTEDVAASFFKGKFQTSHLGSTQRGNLTAQRLKHSDFDRFPGCNGDTADTIAADKQG